MQAHLFNISQLKSEKTGQNYHYCRPLSDIMDFIQENSRQNRGLVLANEIYSSFKITSCTKEFTGVSLTSHI